MRRLQPHHSLQYRELASRFQSINQVYVQAMKARDRPMARIVMLNAQDTPQATDGRRSFMREAQCITQSDRKHPALLSPIENRLASLQANIIQRPESLMTA